MGNAQNGKAKLHKGSGQVSRNGGKARHMKLGQIGRSIVEALPVGIVVFDHKLQIIEANFRARKCSQFSRAFKYFLLVRIKWNHVPWKRVMILIFFNFPKIFNK